MEALIVDGARDRYLLSDRYSGTIVAISRNGYVRSLVSGAGKGSGPALEEPVDLALDADNDRLYVVDNALDAVVRVDPRTGDRTTVSSGSIRTPGSLVVTWDPTKPNNFGVNLENLGVPPDVFVENTPADELRGFDRELKAAVDEALKMLREQRWQYTTTDNGNTGRN